MKKKWISSIVVFFHYYLESRDVLEGNRDEAERSRDEVERSRDVGKCR